jgi:NADPH:quinone reductase-like Zn-dependent oxidoreductase
MKAIVMHHYGGPDVLRYEDVPVPAPGPGEVLLRISGTSFNAGDAVVRAGHAGPYAQRFPLITGFDAAGTVVALGPDVREPAVGDQVIAYLIRPQDGASGQFATAPAEQLAPAPSQIALAAAAAIPVAGLTAWQAIHEHLRVRAGQRILINGAGGGVGRFAVQFAKLAGASVVGVAGPASLEPARTAGADEVIDYQKARPISPVDGALNTANGPDLADLVRHGGTLVSTTSPGARHSGIRTVGRPDAAQLGHIARLVDAGQVSTGVTEHLPMSEMAGVHRRHAAGLLHGKIVLSH